MFDSSGPSQALVEDSLAIVVTVLVTIRPDGGGAGCWVPAVPDSSKTPPLPPLADLVLEVSELPKPFFCLLAEFRFGVICGRISLTSPQIVPRENPLVGDF